MDQSEFERGLAEFQKAEGKFHEAYKSGFRNAPDAKQRYDALYQARYPDSSSEPAPAPVKPQTRADENQARLLAQLDQIRRPGGEHYEKWLKQDPVVLKMRDEIYQQLYPEPGPDETPQGEPAQETPEQMVESLKAQEKAVFEDLRGQWGELAESKFQAARESENFLFEDPGDRKVQEQLYINMGVNRDLISFYAAARQHIDDAVTHPLPSPAVIASLPQQEREALAMTALTRLSGGNPKTAFVERFVKVFSRTPDAEDWYDKIDPAAITWAARIGYRFYNSENTGG